MLKNIMSGLRDKISNYLEVDEKTSAIEKIKNDPFSLMKMSDKMRSDPEIVIRALVEKPDLFIVIGGDLKKDMKFISQIVRVNPTIVNYLDEQTTLSAIKRDASLYKHLGTEMKANKSIAMEAVINHPINFKYVPTELATKPAFYNHVCNKQSDAYLYAPKQILENDEQFVKLGTSKQVLKAHNIPEKYLKNEEIQIYLGIDKPFKHTPKDHSIENFGSMSQSIKADKPKFKH